MDRHQQQKGPPRPKRAPTDEPKPVSWQMLSAILGPPPHGPAGTSVNPAGGVYGESNPTSRAAAKRDAERFEAATGRRPTAEEMAMIERRWLGWGYEA